MFPDNETARKVTVDYTTYAARTISKVADRRLRFVFLSGVLGEKDQSKPLWFMETPRRIKVGHSPTLQHPRDRSIDDVKI